MNAWEGTAVVYGPPQAMGNKSAKLSREGRIVMYERNSGKLRDFQKDMKAAMCEAAPDVLLVDAVSVGIEIAMARPKAHFGTGRNAGVLKANMPSWCTTTPDIDKIMRAILDCGTGVWWADDKQVTKVHRLIKRYVREGEEPSVTIEARELIW